jgi:hypothetical protein
MLSWPLWLLGCAVLIALPLLTDGSYISAALLAVLVAVVAALRLRVRNRPPDGP